MKFLKTVYKHHVSMAAVQISEVKVEMLIFQVRAEVLCDEEYEAFVEATYLNF
jgi:hypothetical protein